MPSRPFQRLTAFTTSPYPPNKRLDEAVPQAVETKDLILDAAELLFSENGVDGVSLRALTREAGVNLASVHYHFGSKEAVARAAFCRRVRPINAERLEMLDRIEREDTADVEGILTALYSPVLRLARSPVRGRRFMRLCARFYSEPGKYLESAFEEEFSEVIMRFERALQRALPELAQPDLRRRMYFAVGVMVHTMLDSNRTRQWTAGACDPLDTDGTLDAMVRFVAAGFRATAKGSTLAAGIQETTQAA